MATTEKCDTCNATGKIITPAYCPRCDNRHVIHWNAPGYGPAISRCPDCEPTDAWREANRKVEQCPVCEGLGYVRR